MTMKGTCHNRKKLRIERGLAAPCGIILHRAGNLHCRRGLPWERNCTCGSEAQTGSGPRGPPFVPWTVGWRRGCWETRVWEAKEGGAEGRRAGAKPRVPALVPFRLALRRRGGAVLVVVGRRVRRPSCSQRPLMSLNWEVTVKFIL